MVREGKGKEVAGERQVVQNQMTGYKRIGSIGNFFAEAIIKKYKKTEEYAYQGISLVFLEPAKEGEEAAPAKSEVSILYHLLLQEIYYKYYNQMVVNRNEILTGIEQSIEQHLSLAERNEPQGFLEVYTLYQEIKHLTEEKNLQKIEELIQERIGITIEKIGGVKEEIETAAETIQEEKKEIQKEIKMVQGDEKEVQKDRGILQEDVKNVQNIVLGDIKEKPKDRKAVQTDGNEIRKGIETVQGNKKTINTFMVQDEKLPKMEEQAEEKNEQMAEVQLLSANRQNKENPDRVILSGTKAYFIKLVQENSVEENRELYQYLQENNLLSYKENVLWKNQKLFTAKETGTKIGEQLREILLYQIGRMPENQMAQAVFAIQEKRSRISVLHNIQEKFFHQIERVKEITNLTGQEYETRQQILLSLVQTATSEEQQTLYQYFDRNHLIYMDTNQINKNQTDKEGTETYETAELLQIVCDMDTEYIQALADKWKREIETKKEEAAEKEISLIQVNQKSGKKQHRETADKKEERAENGLKTEIGIRTEIGKTERANQESDWISGKQRERIESVSAEYQDRIGQGLVYFEWKLKELFGKEIYQNIKQKYLKSLFSVSTEKTEQIREQTEERKEKKTEPNQEENREEITVENNKIQRDSEQKKIWQVAENAGIDLESEREKAVLFSIISAESQSSGSQQLSEGFFSKYRLEETIKNMDESQIKNLVEEWKAERNRIYDRKEGKKDTEEKTLLLRQPLTEIQNIKNRFLHITEEGKPEVIDFLYDYLTDRKLIYRQFEREDKKEYQQTDDKQEKTSVIEEEESSKTKNETEILETEKLYREKLYEENLYQTEEDYQIEKMDKTEEAVQAQQRKKRSDKNKADETEIEAEDLLQKRREIEKFFNYLEETELLAFWQENKEKLSFYIDKIESEEIKQRIDLSIDKRERTEETTDRFEQKMPSVENASDLWKRKMFSFEEKNSLFIKDKEKSVEHLLTMVEAGESETIDSLYEYLTEQKLIYRWQDKSEERRETEFFEKEEKQKKVKKYLKELQIQEGEDAKEKFLISYWNTYLKNMDSEKLQKEEKKTQEKKIQEKRISDEEVSLKKAQAELEKVQPKRIQSEKIQIEKVQLKETSSEKIQLENIQKEEKTVLQIQQGEKDDTITQISKDIRINKESVQTSAVQEKKLYFSILERYQKELQRLGLDRIGGEGSQQEKRIGIFLQILEESNLEESSSLYQYMEQNHLLHYEKHNILEQKEEFRQKEDFKQKEDSKQEKDSGQIKAEQKKREEEIRKEELIEWIQSAAETEFYKLQEKFTEEYEKQQIALIGQYSPKILGGQKGNKIGSVITRYFESLQMLSVQERNKSILEQQKQLLVKTILEGSKEDEQNLYHYLIENHFIYRKEKTETKEQNQRKEQNEKKEQSRIREQEQIKRNERSERKAETKLYSLDKKRILTEQLKQLDTKEFGRIFEQILISYQREQEKKTESKEQNSFLLNGITEKSSIVSRSISDPIKLVYFRRNGKDLVIRDIRITGGEIKREKTVENRMSEHTAYLTKQVVSAIVKKRRIEDKAEGMAESYLLPDRGVRLLFKKEAKKLGEPKEQTQKVREVVEHYITKTAKEAEKQINLEAEYTKREMQKQQQELLLVKTELKRQQEKMREMERNQLKEMNSEKIYQTVMKKMESQIRLERLRRGFS